MRQRLGLCFVLGALLTSTAGQAGTQKCPFEEPGYYPWLADVPRTVDGDEWAWVYLDVDKHGYPESCRIGETNMTEGSRSNTCRNFVTGWRSAPILKDGSPTAGTVKRFFIIAGSKHRQLFDEAKKRWMAAHPDENADCFHN